MYTAIRYLQQGFDWVLAASLMAAVMIVLILLVKVLLRDRLKPRWHYLLWLLVVVRLVLPWEPESSFSIYNLLKYETYTAENASHPPSNITIPSAEPANGSTGTEGTTPNAADPNPGNAAQAESSSEPRLDVYSVLFAIWLFGVLSMAIYTIAANHYVSKRVRRNSQRNFDLRLLEILKHSKDIMSVKRPVALVESGDVQNPALYGVFRPKLVMPLGLSSLTDSQLKHVFMHEIAHLKRNDIAMNWLFHTLLILHWFNPVLWYGYYRMRVDQEMACDAFVLSRMDKAESLNYGRTIIQLMENFSHPILLGSAQFAGNKRHLKRRITMIKMFKKGSYRWSILGIAAIVLLSGCALTNAKSITGGTSTPAITPGNSPEPGSQPSTQPAQQDALDEIAALAREGKVQGSDFAAATSMIDQVKAQWGQPDQENPAGKGIYATYTKQGITFGYNKGNQIFDVRSYDSGLKSIALSQVKDKLGNASSEQKVGKETILTYDISSQYQLKFIFPEAAQELADPKLDHISVYSPQAATNLAQDGSSGTPAPKPGTPVTKAKTDLLKRMKDLAAKGQMIYAESFVVGKTLIDDVYKQWGEPNRPISAGNPYAMYAPGMLKGTIEFAPGRGEIVKEIRVGNVALDAEKDGSMLTYSDVMQVLGKPSQTQTADKQQVLIYKMGDYELRVIAPQKKSDTDNPKITYVSVYSPKAAAPMGGS